MKLTIVKSDIYDVVRALTTRIGVAKGNLDVYACTKDHYGILDTFLPGVVSDAEGVLRRKLTASNDFSMTSGAGDTIDIDVNDHDGMLADSVDGLLVTQLRLYCAYSLVALWMDVFDADVSKVYLESAAGCIATVTSALNQRNTPTADYSVRSDDVASMSEVGVDADYSVRSDDDIVIRRGVCPSGRLLEDTDGDVLQDDSGDFLMINERLYER